MGLKPIRRNSNQGRKMRIPLFLLLLVLGGCGDAASTWDDKSGHFIPTEEYQERQIERAIDKHDRDKEDKHNKDCYAHCAVCLHDEDCN